MPKGLLAGDVEAQGRVEVLAEGIIPSDVPAHCLCLLEPEISSVLSILMRRTPGRFCTITCRGRNGGRMMFLTRTRLVNFIYLSLK